MSEESEESERPSPNEFMRKRRPEQFSDASFTEHKILNRSLLEYHLDSITSRGQENDFEAFCIKLAEQEICPNLIPQTGPTGGGDSKVDSETYPVADSISEIWYSGLGREASTERWAFAISAKKEWRSKVQSDVKKIIETNRGYGQVFFMSNQFISGKKRSEVEDTLEAKYGIPIHIIDRTWLLNKVFSSKHEQLAINALSLHVDAKYETNAGSQDIERAKQLEELQERIKKAVAEQQYSMLLVDDCINAGILSRELEKPIDTTNGLFTRAVRLANKYGNTSQRLHAVYQQAWTAHWWHEDWEHFDELYDQVEKLAIGSDNVYDLERLQNLWSIYYGGAEAGRFSRKKAEHHTALIKDELLRLIKVVGRPSTVLQARSQLLILRLMIALSQKDSINGIFKEMHVVLEESEGLLGFDIGPFIKMIEEIGDFINDIPDYDDLLEKATEIISKRQSDVTAAKMLVNRGVQLCEATKFMDAIRKFGKALNKLYKHESRFAAVKALSYCGLAYQNVGLNWAARNSTLMSASIASDELWRYGEITPAQVTCFYQLAKHELIIGRIPLALAWFEVYLVFRTQLGALDYDDSTFEDERDKFDQVLGLLLLKSDLTDLERIGNLPEPLEKLGLGLASLALTYALGHLVEIQTDPKMPQDVESLNRFFFKWLHQPALYQLPDKPQFCYEETVLLKSEVLGCDIIAIADNELSSILLAESALAAFESFVSTSLDRKLIFIEPTLLLRVRFEPGTRWPFDFTIDEVDGRPVIQVLCGHIQSRSVTSKQRNEQQEKSTEMLIQMLACVLAITETDGQLKELFKEENAISRAVDFTSSLVTTINILDDNPKYRLADWAPTSKDRTLVRGYFCYREP
jgi:hypothetical protein